MEDLVLHLTDEEIGALGEGQLIVRDDHLTRPQALRIATEVGAIALHPAQVRIGQGIRDDHHAWLDADTAPPGLSAYLERLEPMRQELNRGAYLGLTRWETQVARYAGDGARYERHRDAFADAPRSRVVTAIYYLNPAWEPAHGGLLRAWCAGRAHDVEPRLDRLVLFLSTLVEHEVLPVHAPRVAITTWFY